MRAPANCRHSPEMQRVFLAVPVAHRLQKRIDRLLAPVRSANQDIRWVAAQNRHLTLAFLGDQPEPVVDALADSMDDAYPGESRFDAAFSALTRFPDARGRILALVGHADDRLSSLFEITRGLLAQFSLAPEFEIFRPHITVGRIIKPRLFKTRLFEPATFELHVDRVTLYQSTLTPAGSVYRALKETRLGLKDAGPG